MKKKELTAEVATPLTKADVKKIVDDINATFKRLYSSPKKG